MDAVKKQRLIQFLATGLSKYTKLNKTAAEKKVIEQLEKGRTSNEILADILGIIGKKLPSNVPDYKL